MNKKEWENLWGRFDAWCEMYQDQCTKCGHISPGPDWEEQKEKIEELVDDRQKESDK